jgi:hypothetical protein
VQRSLILDLTVRQATWISTTTLDLHEWCLPLYQWLCQPSIRRSNPRLWNARFRDAPTATARRTAHVHHVVRPTDNFGHPPRAMRTWWQSEPQSAPFDKPRVATRRAVACRARGHRPIPLRRRICLTTLTWRVRLYGRAIVCKYQKIKDVRTKICFRGAHTPRTLQHHREFWNSPAPRTVVSTARERFHAPGRCRSQVADQFNRRKG